MAELAPRIVVSLVFAYLVGGIPWALIIGKRFYKINPLEHGSGNLGATNVFRLLGARAAIATLVLDAAKGSVAVAAAGVAVPESMGSEAHWWAMVGAMMAAVLGHSYSPYIGLKGGKGVATSAGALFVITPAAALIELVLFIALVSTTRIVSLGSVTIALIYPLLVLWLYPDNTPVLITIVVLASLVIWRHRANIVRIVRGEENRISFRERGSATGNDEED